MRAIRAGGRSSREVPGPRAAKDWRMQTDGSSATSDDFRLRLAWDGDNAGDEELGAGRSPRQPAERAAAPQGRSDRDRVVEGQSVSVRVDSGGRRFIKKTHLTL